MVVCGIKAWAIGRGVVTLSMVMEGIAVMENVGGRVRGVGHSLMGNVFFFLSFLLRSSLFRIRNAKKGRSGSHVNDPDSNGKEGPPWEDSDRRRDLGVTMRRDVLDGGRASDEATLLIFLDIR